MRNRNDARTRRHAVDVHRARATRTDAAAVLRSRHLQIFTQHPEQRCRRIDVHFSVAVRLQLIVSRHGSGLLSSGWARRAGLDPATRGSNEFFMRERRQCAHRSIGSATGIPRPLHECFFFVMFEQTWSIEIVILANGQSLHGRLQHSTAGDR